MKHSTNVLTNTALKMRPEWIRLMWALICLGLFVIGAGAPDAGGNMGG